MLSYTESLANQRAARTAWQNALASKNAVEAFYHQLVPHLSPHARAAAALQRTALRLAEEQAYAAYCSALDAAAAADTLELPLPSMLATEGEGNVILVEPLANVA